MTAETREELEELLREWTVAAARIAAGAPAGPDNDEPLAPPDDQLVRCLVAEDEVVGGDADRGRSGFSSAGASHPPKRCAVPPRRLPALG